MHEHMNVFLFIVEHKIPPKNRLRCSVGIGVGSLGLTVLMAGGKGLSSYIILKAACTM